MKTHETERHSISCCICGASYSSMVALRLHQRTHTNENPLLCPIPQCEQSFRSSVYRKRHVEQCHRSSYDVDSNGANVKQFHRSYDVDSNGANDQSPHLASTFECKKKLKIPPTSVQLEVLENGHIAVSPTTKLEKAHSAIVDFESFESTGNPLLKTFWFRPILYWNSFAPICCLEAPLRVITAMHGDSFASSAISDLIGQVICKGIQ